MKIPTPKFSYFEGTTTAELLIFNIIQTLIRSFPGGSDGKKSSCNAGDPGSIAGSGISLEKGMATHSSILAWRIQWTEEPGKLQPMGSQRVEHN